MRRIFESAASWSNSSQALQSAAWLDTPRQIVSKWRKRFALARLPGLEEQPRGGRPALFFPQRRRAGKSSRPVSYSCELGRSDTSGCRR